MTLLKLYWIVLFFFKQKTAYEIGLGIPAEPLFRSDLPPSPTKSSNLSETAEVPACNVPSRSPLPALAIAPETKLGTASSGLGTSEPRTADLIPASPTPTVLFTVASTAPPSPPTAAA